MGADEAHPAGAGSEAEKWNVPCAPGTDWVVPGVVPRGGKSVLVTIGTVGRVVSVATEQSMFPEVRPGSTPPWPPLPSTVVLSCEKYSSPSTGLLKVNPLVPAAVLPNVLFTIVPLLFQMSQPGLTSSAVSAASKSAFSVTALLAPIQGICGVEFEPDWQPKLASGLPGESTIGGELCCMVG